MIVDVNGPAGPAEFVEASASPESATIKPVPDDRLNGVRHWDHKWRRSDIEVARGFVYAVFAIDT